jgi:hypothetical protein
MSCARTSAVELPIGRLFLPRAYCSERLGGIGSLGTQFLDGQGTGCDRAGVAKRSVVNRGTCAMACSLAVVVAAGCGGESTRGRDRDRAGGSGSSGVIQGGAGTRTSGLSGSAGLGGRSANAGAPSRGGSSGIAPTGSKGGHGFDAGVAGDGPTDAGEPGIAGETSLSGAPGQGGAAGGQNAGGAPVHAGSGGTSGRGVGGNPSPGGAGAGSGQGGLGSSSAPGGSGGSPTAGGADTGHGFGGEAGARDGLPAGALSISLAPPGADFLGRTCHAGASGGFTYAIGRTAPPQTIEDGQDGVVLSCAVLGPVGGPFDVSITLSGTDENAKKPVSVTLAGTVAPASTSGTSTMTLGFYSPDTSNLSTLDGFPACVVAEILVLKPGAMLASISCPLIAPDDDTTTSGCKVYGSIAVEYCESSE